MEIQDLKAKISALKSQIKRLEWASEKIKDAQEEFAWTIKKKLPYCKFEEEATVVDVYVGEWSYDRFDRYLYSVWGTYPKSLVKSRSTYHVQNVNLFSGVWYSDYWGSDNAYGYDNSFSCTGLISRPAYYGTISKIGASSVWVVDDDNDEWELNFSSCSVFQSATGSKYPRKGDRVIWNGSRRSYSGYAYKVRNAICL